MSYSPPASAKPFTLHVSDHDLSEWRQLLQLSKLAPETWEGHQQDRRFGVTHKWLSETKDYWLNKYDWRAAEAHINSFSNYRMQIETVDVHFVALFSEKKDAIPIILMHGWPGSFIEFLPMLKLVKDKYSAKDLPYHLVVPSLPGYTLSTLQSTKDKWTMKDTGRVMNQLMLNLGFSKYISQGGDVGSFITQILAANYDECVALHMNLASRTSEPDANTVMTQVEQEAVQRSKTWYKYGTAYAQEHGTRPSTIGNVLSSNPLALLAWIGEKLLEWTDEDPSLDDILTNISLYWFTSCFPTTLYPYRALFGEDSMDLGPTNKPFGYSFFPYELRPGVKSILEKETNLVAYKAHERGGHFAALEQPQALLEDVEEFAQQVWKV
ncbi:uncharacterized protein SETTUDRAFT_162049 [Exserohilum turcica Et28A]|uniref:Epoxide hydrolase N-terminal domain-containing protein n=1 Tax=Exserohilum turcicum (strain 28A) TaxID=671987 RepID=R0J3H2_EXST2|nr:uncharacterized protein SETTUDRAFT_162049 [Exserohilum turcica Et28A]EOA91286.1 hypothetical protein SETTUDRAFT_162049 [Exserohilum turcica Et28A]